jgi:3-hydroxyisobutyrate dehydrogenase-like beta-hydroxyacid dehydrogenase
MASGFDWIPCAIIPPPTAAAIVGQYGAEMRFETVAVLSPGDMGHAVGAFLNAGGRRIVTSLAGRSEATRARAARAGFEDLASIERVVALADLILSILPPSDAEALAGRFAESVASASGAAPVFVDCNAVSPATAKRMAGVVAASGAVFLDGGLIGAPPGRGSRGTRLYLSGPSAQDLEVLERPASGDREAPELLVRVIGEEIGRASGLKMVYAALTKGTMTLHTAVLVTAHRLGLYSELTSELGESQQQALARMGVIPFLPADAGRWIGEMEEIASTFDDVGVTPAFHEAAAEIFRALAATPFAEETRETLDRSRTLEDTIRVLARAENDPAD